MGEKHSGTEYGQNKVQKNQHKPNCAVEQRGSVVEL